jgi:MoxR-like ATPase
VKTSSTDLNSTSDARDRLQALQKSLTKAIPGQDDLIENLLLGFIAGGHVLLEGLPGLAKTTLVRLLAQGLGLPFGRVQMTPDLMPADIVGSSILKPDLSGFVFLPGPVFTTILLVDELNRAPARVQSALLEAMQEKQVTAGGETRPLAPLFWVVATQNPIEQEGTYPLAESQKDRFSLRLRVNYPPTNQESAVIGMIHDPLDQPFSESGLTPTDFQLLRTIHENIHMSDLIVQWATRLVQATREPSLVNVNQKVAWGVSPRGARMWLKVARVRAWWHGRDYLIPEDLRQTADSALSHRIQVAWNARRIEHSEKSLPLVLELMNAIGPP